MNLILYLSEAVIPILVLLIVGNGLMHRQHVYCLLYTSPSPRDS